MLPKGWVLQMNDRAWMNEEVMLKWVKILHPYTQQHPALLVMDSFSAHTTQVKTELAKINTYPGIIPEGYISYMLI